MKKENTKKEFTLNATNKSLGRVASEAASILMGKNRADFTRHQAPDVTVTIENASKINTSPRKQKQKTYVRNTGYPGGKREESMAFIIDRKGYSVVFEKAVYGMLPNNKLRKQMLKNLKVVD